MSKFDWSAHPVVKQDKAPAFDWSAHPRIDDDVPQQDPSITESLLRGAAQGVTLGNADEITGLLQSLTSGKTYEQARNESRANYKAAEQANPIASTVGNLGGGLATALIPGVGEFGMGEGIMGAAKMGALYGGAGAVGSSEQDLLHPSAESVGNLGKEMLGGTALGAATGTVMGGIAKGASMAIKAYKGDSVGKEVIDAYKYAKADPEFNTSEFYKKQANSNRDMAEQLLNKVEGDVSSNVDDAYEAAKSNIEPVPVKDIMIDLLGTSGDKPPEVNLKNTPSMDSPGKAKMLSPDDLMALKESFKNLAQPTEANLDVPTVAKLDSQPAVGTLDVPTATNPDVPTVAKLGILSDQPLAIKLKVIQSMEGLGKDGMLSPDDLITLKDTFKNFAQTFMVTSKGNPNANSSLYKAYNAAADAVESRLQSPEFIEAQAMRSKQGDVRALLASKVSGKNLDARKLTKEDKIDALKDSALTEQTDDAANRTIRYEKGTEKAKDLQKFTDDLPAGVTQADADAKAGDDYMGFLNNFNDNIRKEHLSRLSRDPSHLATNTANFLSTMGRSARGKGMLAASYAGDAARGYNNMVDRMINAPTNFLETLGGAMIKAGKPVGNIILKAAGKPDAKRKALLFSLMQQPGIREMLQEHIDNPDYQK